MNSLQPLPLSPAETLSRLAWTLLDQTVLRNPWIPREVKAQGFPSLRQALFLTVPAREIFYGGAARGGKSWALLAAALQYFDRPGYSALLLRRSYQDLALPGALMDVAHQWLRGSGARWNGTEHQWVNTANGARINFGYLDNENDKYRYQSAQFQFIGFDEVTQFSDTQYTYLFSRLTRPEGSDLPIRMRCASNPGGVGHDWVKARFVTSSDRVFIPARLEDNPGVDKAEYERALGELDNVTRAQLRMGDWDIQPAGNLFKRAWFEIVDEQPVQASRCRFWDLAATDPQDSRRGKGSDPDYTCGPRVSRSRSGIYYIEHMVRGRWGPRDVEDIILQAAKYDGTGTRIRMEQEPGASGKTVIDHYSRLLAGYDFAGVPASGEKSTRWRPMSAQSEAGNVKLVRGPWVEAFLDEAERVPQTGVHDDQVDAASGGFNELALHRTTVGFY